MCEIRIQKIHKIYIWTHTHTQKCAPTHVYPRACLFSHMRKTIFGIQAASYMRGTENRWNGITHVCVWAWVRASTRTRPAFDCILRIYSSRRVYARHARFAFSSSFSSPFLPFHFSFFARILRVAVLCVFQQAYVYRLINAEWYPFWNLCHFHFRCKSSKFQQTNEVQTSENVWKSGLSGQRGLNAFTRRDLCNKICVAIKSERTVE